MYIASAEPRPPPPALTLRNLLLGRNHDHQTCCFLRIHSRPPRRIGCLVIFVYGDGIPHTGWCCFCRPWTTITALERIIPRSLFPSNSLNPAPAAIIFLRWWCTRWSFCRRWTTTTGWRRTPRSGWWGSSWAPSTRGQWTSQTGLLYVVVDS